MSDSCLIKKTVPLAGLTQFYLSPYELPENESVPADGTIGGVLSNSKYAWYANGPRFQVVNLLNARTIASWTFGSVVKDPSTKVVCVTEIPNSNRDTPLLIIGLECVSTGGTICIFNLLTSKVLRAIQLNNKVTSVCVVDCGKNLLPLHGPLRSFDGVIGVGSLGGDVLLIDLSQHSIDEEAVKDELDACQILPLSYKDLNNLEHCKQTLLSGTHLAIHLNVDYSNKTPHFSLKGPNGETRVHVNKSEVAVSSLHYCPQLGSLLVGFNFGAWQLWELLTVTLLYTSPVYEENIPVSHFAVQEPTDDPKPFCYVWAVYSSTELYQQGFPVAVLYSLSYENKEYHEGYGYLYQDLHSCTVRFQMELTSIDQHPNTTFQGANCLRLTSYNKNHVNKTNPMENHDDTLNICSLVWNVWGTERVDTYFSLFDLNQWYKAQMPGSPNGRNDNYLSIISVSNLIDNSCKPLMDVCINELTVKQILGVQKPEEHYYPTALSYEFCVCNDKMAQFIHHQGKQRNLLNNLEKAEALILLKPTEACQRAVELGLTPLYMDTTINNISRQREFLLSLALEQQMTGWLCRCVSTWSNGSFVSTGCSLEFFLEWAWARACLLKSNADSLCVPLFDYSETVLDSNSLKILNVCVNQLLNLRSIYTYVLKKLDGFIKHKDIVQQQCSSLQIVCTHLEVLQWLINTKLLPESSESCLYPIESLLTYYNERRTELEVAYKQRFSSREDLLFIDNLLKNEFADMSLQEVWKMDDGNGLYPPPSMQSLLRTYLNDKVQLANKHSVLIYAFLDLAKALDINKFSFVITQLIKFPTVFQLNSSTVKITQAFWHLDHGDFGSALERLLDPQLQNTDLKLWHHRTVLNAFLVQGQHNSALTYFQLRKPSLTDDDDLLKIVTLFIENSLINEAMEFQRTHSNSVNQLLVLTHFFRECTATKQVKKLLHYPLSNKEERILMQYMKQIEHPDQEEYEIMYYLQRFRYMDIFQMPDKQQKFTPAGLVGQKSLPFKDNVVRTLSGFFPKVSKDLFQFCKYQKDTLRNKIISRPRPMSVFVHNTEEKAKYKSTLIGAGIMKAKETWSHTVLDDMSTAEDIPFMRTPIVFKSIDSRKRSSIICPKVIRANEAEDVGESPNKRMRLSSREAVGSSVTRSSFSESSFSMSERFTKFDTPIVKRKSRRLSQSLGLATPGVTPQSILKVRNLITSQLPVQESTPKLLSSTKNNLPTSGVNTLGFGLTPRKSLSRSTVRFETSANILSCSETGPAELSGFLNVSKILKPDEPETDVTEKSQTNDSKNTSESTEEVYYSPESSLPDDCNKSNLPMEENQHLAKFAEKSLPPDSSNLPIKGRNSYKDQSLDKGVKESVPIREDFETTSKGYKDQSVDGSINESVSIDEEFETTPKTPTSPIIASPSSSKQRLRGRKSLSRLVLENNAFSTLSMKTRRTRRQSITPTGNKIEISRGSSSTSSKSFNSTVMSEAPSPSNLGFDDGGESSISTRKINEDETTMKRDITEQDETTPATETNESPVPKSPTRRSSLRVAGRNSISSKNASLKTITPRNKFEMPSVPDVSRLTIDVKLNEEECKIVECEEKSPIITLNDASCLTLDKQNESSSFADSSIMSNFSALESDYLFSSVSFNQSACDISAVGRISESKTDIAEKLEEEEKIAINPDSKEIFTPLITSTSSSTLVPLEDLEIPSVSHVSHLTIESKIVECEDKSPINTLKDASCLTLQKQNESSSFSDSSIISNFSTLEPEYLFSPVSFNKSTCDVSKSNANIAEILAEKEKMKTIQNSKEIITEYRNILGKKVGQDDEIIDSVVKDVYEEEVVIVESMETDQSIAVVPPLEFGDDIQLLTDEGFEVTPTLNLLELNVQSATSDNLEVPLPPEESPTSREVRELNIAYVTSYEEIETDRGQKGEEQQLHIAPDEEEQISVNSSLGEDRSFDLNRAHFLSPNSSLEQVENKRTSDLNQAFLVSSISSNIIEIIDSSDESFKSERSSESSVSINSDNGRELDFAFIKNNSSIETASFSKSDHESDTYHSEDSSNDVSEEKDGEESSKHVDIVHNVEDSDQSVDKNVDDCFDNNEEMEAHFDRKEDDAMSSNNDNGIFIAVKEDEVNRDAIEDDVEACFNDVGDKEDVNKLETYVDVVSDVDDDKNIEHAFDDNEEMEAQVCNKKDINTSNNDVRMDVESCDAKEDDDGMHDMEDDVEAIENLTLQLTGESSQVANLEELPVEDDEKQICKQISKLSTTHSPEEENRIDLHQEDILEDYERKSKNQSKEREIENSKESYQKIDVERMLERDKGLEIIESLKEQETTLPEILDCQTRQIETKDTLDSLPNLPMEDKSISINPENFTKEEEMSEITFDFLESTSFDIKTPRKNSQSSIYGILEMTPQTAEKKPKYQERFDLLEGTPDTPTAKIEFYRQFPRAFKCSRSESNTPRRRSSRLASTEIIDVDVEKAEDCKKKIARTSSKLTDDSIKGHSELSSIERNKEIHLVTEGFQQSTKSTSQDPERRTRASSKSRDVDTEEGKARSRTLQSSKSVNKEIEQSITRTTSKDMDVNVEDAQELTKELPSHNVKQSVRKISTEIMNVDIAKNKASTKRFSSHEGNEEILEKAVANPERFPECTGSKSKGYQRSTRGISKSSEDDVEQERASTSGLSSSKRTKGLSVDILDAERKQDEAAAGKLSSYERNEEIQRTNVNFDEFQDHTRSDRKGVKRSRAPSKSRDVDLEEDKITTSFPSPKSEGKKVQSKRTRTSSEDKEVKFLPQRRTRRAVSTDAVIKQNNESSHGKLLAKRTKRTVSVSGLPTIPENETKEDKKVVKGSVKKTKTQIGEQPSTSSDVLEEFTSTRRVTRNQKSLLSRSQDIKNLLKLDTAYKNMEDNEIIQRGTSPGTTEESIISSKMRTRGYSTESQSSVTTITSLDQESVSPKNRSKKQQSTPNRNTRASSRKTDITSDTESNASSMSSVRRSTRSKSKTPEIQVVQKGTKKSSDLPQILEEPENLKESETPQRKRLRSRKGDAV